MNIDYLCVLEEVTISMYMYMVYFEHAHDGVTPTYLKKAMFGHICMFK